MFPISSDNQGSRSAAFRQPSASDRNPRHIGKIAGGVCRHSGVSRSKWYPPMDPRGCFAHPSESTPLRSTPLAPASGQACFCLAWAHCGVQSGAAVNQTFPGYDPPVELPSGNRKFRRPFHHLEPQQRPDRNNQRLRVRPLGRQGLRASPSEARPTAGAAPLPASVTLLVSLPDHREPIFA